MRALQRAIAWAATYVVRQTSGSLERAMLTTMELRLLVDAC